MERMQRRSATNRLVLDTSLKVQATIGVLSLPVIIGQGCLAIYGCNKLGQMQRGVLVI